MKNIFIRSAFLGIPALLFLSPGAALSAEKLDRLDLEINAASRVDQFDWNIAGNSGGTTPNILSELTWEDLEINEVSTRGRVVMVNNHVPFGGTLRGSISYGEIFSGKNQDSDYGGDDRTLEFSRSNNLSENGEVWDINLGGGLVFKSRNRKLTLSPLVGYAFHAQYLKIHGGDQTISGINPFGGANPPLVGPIADLNSSYDAEWQSGWVGLDLEFQPTPNFEFYGGVEFHLCQYEAAADWNLRSDLNHPVSFYHKSDEATGVVSNVGLRVGWRNLLFNAEMRYQKFLAEDGIDRTYFADGTIGVTRLNEVNWESTSIGGGITLRF